MIETQLKARDIKDKGVLNAMLVIPRHLFVPEDLRYLAYQDRPLPIGYNQTISQPYIVALMTSVLHLNQESKVLEIGTGSGYQAAVLGQLCKEVYTIEIVEELAATAAALFEQLQYRNIYSKPGDGYKGWPEKAPFDAIIVTAAAPNVPGTLIEQLKTGNDMIIPLGRDEHNQNLSLVTKVDKNNNYTIKDLSPVMFVPMTGQVNE